MKTTVQVLSPSREFTTKAGGKAYLADATFDDEGARFPVGRARVYSDKPLQGGKAYVALLVSYDRDGARFSVRESR